jgi:hypothetical protein
MRIQRRMRKPSAIATQKKRIANSGPPMMGGTEERLSGLMGAPQRSSSPKRKRQAATRRLVRSRPPVVRAHETGAMRLGPNADDCSRRQAARIDQNRFTRKMDS